MRLLAALLLLLAPLAARASEGGVPLVLTHQGRLLDEADRPVSGIVSMTFELHETDNVAIRQPLWTDTRRVTVAGGQYAVVLGDTVRGGSRALDPALLTKAELFLSVNINEAELLPRLRVASVPYALRAGRVALAESVAAGGVTTAALADGAVTGDKIAAGAVTADKLAVAGGRVEGLGADTIDGLDSTQLARADHAHTASAVTDFGAAAVQAVAAGGLPWSSVRDVNGAAWPGSLSLEGTVTGRLPVASGGTGRADVPAGALLTGAGTQPLGALAPGAGGTVLRSNGSAWQASALQLSDLPEGLVTGSGATGALPRFTGARTLGPSRIVDNGGVGIGTQTPRATLDVAGAAVVNPAIEVTTATVDFAAGNLQYTARSCGAFALHNLKDGGSYMFYVQGATAAACSFQAFSDAGSAALSVRLPPGHGATFANKHTVYNFVVLGTTVLVAWTPGY